MELQALKGVGYCPMWGLSLDFVPHITAAGDTKWHRTAKSARFDFVYRPIDFLPTSADARDWSVSLLATREELADDLARVTRMVVAEAIPFLDRIVNLDDLPSLYREHRGRPPVGLPFDCFPQQVLASAFVSARCRAGAGQNELAEYIRAYDVAPETARRLEELLAAAATTVSDKGMKQTNVAHIGRSQLIAGALHTLRSDMAHESDWDVVVERASAPWVYVAGAALAGGLLGVMLADLGVTGPSIAAGLLPSLVAALEGMSIAGYRVRRTREATNDARPVLGIRLLPVVAIFCMAGAMAVAETWTLQLVAPHTSLTARFALLGAGVAGLASWWAWRTAFTATSK